MKPRILFAEVIDEPRLEAAAEVGPKHFVIAAALVAIHEVADFVEQTLVVELVERKPIISALAHHGFLQSEMGSNARIDLA